MAVLPNMITFNSTGIASGFNDAIAISPYCSPRLSIVSFLVFRVLFIDSQTPGFISTSKALTIRYPPLAK